MIFGQILKGSGSARLNFEARSLAVWNYLKSFEIFFNWKLLLEFNLVPEKISPDRNLWGF